MAMFKAWWSFVGQVLLLGAIIIGCIFLAAIGFQFLAKLQVWGVVIGVSLAVLMCFYAHVGGIFESNVRCVRINQVRLTLQGGPQETLRKAAWADLEFCRGRTLKAFVSENQHIEKRYGPGHRQRASPARSIPVLADLDHPGERFWALQNARLMRYMLSGYADVRVHVVKPKDVSPEVCHIFDRWQQLHVGVARSKSRELANALKGVELACEYPNYCQTGYKDLRVYFHAMKLADSKRRKTANVLPKQDGYTIDELEMHFEPLIREARLAWASKRVKKNGTSSSEKSGDAAQVDPGGGDSSSAAASAESGNGAADSALPSCEPMTSCGKGHPLRPWQQKTSSTCAACSTKIAKNEWVMVCDHKPACSWQACRRCAPRSMEEDEDDDAEDDGLCVCCLDNAAAMVMKNCGHLVFCADCCCSAVAYEAGAATTKHVTAQQHAKTKISCPICRQVSVAVPKRGYRKVVYKQ